MRNKTGGKTVKVLSGILDYLKDVFGSDNRVLAIEIGDDVVKAVESDVTKSGKAVTGVVAVGISPDAPDRIFDAASRAVASFRPNPRRIIVNIPRHMVTARFLSIPATDDNEISKIVGIESIKHLPYTEEEVIYGYRVTEKTPEGYSKVLLAITQHHVVNGLIDIANRISPDSLRSLSLSSEGLYLWYESVRDRSKDENVMLVNLDSDHIDIDITENGKLSFTRGISFDRDDPKRNTRISADINISISTHQKESARKVDRIVLTGSRSGIDTLRHAISETARLPVDVADQSEIMPAASSVHADSEETSFVELIGLSMNPQEARINLMPESSREDARISVMKKHLVFAFVSVTILFALVASAAFKKINDRNIFLSAINSELKSMEPRAASAKKMLKDIGVIRDIMARRPLAIDIISDVSALTPAGISLAMIDFESGKSVTIRGIAPSLGEALKYVSSLGGSRHLEGVKIRYANKRMTEGRENADFEISAIPVGNKRQEAAR